MPGSAAGIAQYWWTRSLYLAPTSAVVPFNYFSLVWAMMLGFAVWGDGGWEMEGMVRAGEG